MISDWNKVIEIGGKIAAASGGKVKVISGLRELAAFLFAQYTENVFEGNKAYATKFFSYNLDIIIRMNKAGAAGKLSPFSPAWNGSFLDNEHIFYPCAPWTAQWILKPNDPDSVGRWGVTTAPVRGYSYGGTAYGIPTKAKNKLLAWKFIEWATTTEDGVKACQDVVGAIVSREATYANGFPSVPDPYFAGQDANAYLMQKAMPTMKIRLINQYDVMLNDVFVLIVDKITNDTGITLENAVQMAIAELKNKLPSNLTIE